MFKEITAVSRYEIQDLDPEKSYAVISITDPGYDHCTFPQNENFKDVLRLKFHDIMGVKPKELTKEQLDKIQRMVMPDGQPFIMFEDYFAQKILDFVETTDADMIICQCEKGISRSAAVAGALAQIYLEDDSSIMNNPRYQPNMAMFEIMLETATKA